MNRRHLLWLSCLLAVTIIAGSTVNAGPQRRTNNGIGSMPARTGVARTFVNRNRIGGWNGQRWNRQYWSGRNWNTRRWNNWNWHHNHHHFRDFVFFDIGFPFWGWWGYPYYYDYYPYSYYPYGYYGDEYYGSSAYNYGNGYAYNNNSYGYSSGSNVAELQRKLTDAGYYHGPIDGIMGSRTYYALKAYRHDHSNGNNINGGYSPTLRDRPYTPPPATTDRSPSEE
jgi:hypothetical protein